MSVVRKVTAQQARGIALRVQDDRGTRIAAHIFRISPEIKWHPSYAVGVQDAPSVLVIALQFVRKAAEDGLNDSYYTPKVEAHPPETGDVAYVAGLTDTLTQSLRDLGFLVTANMKPSIGHGTTGHCNVYFPMCISW